MSSVFLSGTMCRHQTGAKTLISLLLVSIQINDLYQN